MYALLSIMLVALLVLCFAAFHKGYVSKKRAVEKRQSNEQELDNPVALSLSGDDQKI
eukprot:SAG11_NODE_967_length_6356_cov_6.743008_5_plen_57_part_00